MEIANTPFNVKHESFLFPTNGLSPQATRLVGRINKALSRAYHCDARGRHRRAYHHGRRALKLVDRIIERRYAAIVPMSAIEAPVPPHTEPEYT